MEQQDSDIFELTKKTQVQNNVPDYFAEDDNFFANESIKQDNSRRLNDYDFNILKDGAYKDVTDDVFKLGYKISKTEEILWKNEISANKTVIILSFVFVCFLCLDQR